MLRHERSAPIWLFSFVDLAFLLLIAFTQIGPDGDQTTEALVGLEMPRIHGPGLAEATAATGEGWQLRVHPVDPGSDAADRTPFTLIRSGSAPNETAASADAATGVSAEELADQLALLRDRRAPRPLLAPHRDSRSEDLLVAVALLEDVWQGSRRVSVRPGPPVAAAPRAEDRDAASRD